MRAKQFTRRIREAAGDGDVANAVVAEVIKLIGEGHTEVSPDVITTKVSAVLGRPFMLKDLVAANNASPELQHYIDSINPSKIKFSTDILTVKNQDPVKEKERAEAGVANMAARAASRPRLGESVTEGWNTGSDRVHLPDEPSTYWSGNGALQKEYEELYDKLVPAMGAADTIEGEVLRAASKIVYRHYNDGDEFNAASFSQLVPYIGKVTSYDDLAHKATEFALKANGEYHPNAGWDSLDVMDYGPEDYSDDYDEDDDWDDEEEDTSWDQDDDEDLDEARADQIYTVDITRRDRTRSTSGTIPELLDYFGYTLEVGKSYEHERGRYKINMNPKTIQQLVDNLNKAASNGAANGAASTFYSQGNEDLDEGWESGPEERQPRERDPDAEYDDMRQLELDAKADAEQAKRPQKKVYTLTGRGPNYEPNYAFPGEYDSQEAAVAARAKLMADPSTPNPRDIGISTHTRYLDEYTETPLRDLEDYNAKKKALQDLQTDPDTSKDPELSLTVMKRLAGLEKQRSELK